MGRSLGTPLSLVPSTPFPEASRRVGDGDKPRTRQVEREGCGRRWIETVRTGRRRDQTAFVGVDGDVGTSFGLNRGRNRVTKPRPRPGGTMRPSRRPTPPAASPATAVVRSLSTTRATSPLSPNGRWRKSTRRKMTRSSAPKPRKDLVHWTVVWTRTEHVAKDSVAPLRVRRVSLGGLVHAGWTPTWSWPKATEDLAGRMTIASIDELANADDWMANGSLPCVASGRSKRYPHLTTTGHSLPAVFDRPHAACAVRGRRFPSAWQRIHGIRPTRNSASPAAWERRRVVGSTSTPYRRASMVVGWLSHTALSTPSIRLDSTSTLPSSPGRSLSRPGTVRHCLPFAEASWKDEDRGGSR